MTDKTRRAHTTIRRGADALVRWDRIRSDLAQARTIDEVKQVRDKAEALRLYVKQAGESLEVQNTVAEIKIRAERRAGELLEEMETTKQRAGKGDKKQMSHRATLPDLNITRSQSSRWQQVARIPETTFSRFVAETKAAGAELTSVATIKLAKTIKRQTTAETDSRATEEAQEAVSKARRTDLEKVCKLRVCSCRELLAEEAAPDAVITDPPYAKEFLPVFSELAEACAKANVPLVAVMSGQTYLPDVMRRLCEHLTYRWMMAYMTPGGQAVQQWKAKVNTSWKPVLLFGEAQEWFGDVAISKPNDNDKRFHGWGQSESGMADLVERLTKPGQLVCDPFSGGGTTAVVCLALGRSFVGCDIDAVCVETTRARVR